MEFENFREDLSSFSVHFENNINKLPVLWSSHEQLEIQFVNTGNYILHIGNEEYNLCNGDIAVVAPNKLHKIEPLTEDDMSLTVIKISSSINKEFKQHNFTTTMGFLKNIVPVIRLEEEQQQGMALILKRLIIELKEKKELYNYYALNLLELFLIEITRQFGKKLVQEEDEDIIYEQHDMSRLIKNVIQYINQNYMNNINLSKIAKRFWVNPSYLSREFKSNVGMNITEFINERRIYYAKILLLTTEKIIIEVAMEVGFKNVPYFNKVFKNRVGMTPKEFMEKNKNKTMNYFSIKMKNN